MAERAFGPYRLVRQIAVGGMAEIHLAKTRGIAGFEKFVALKMIHPNFAQDEQFIQMLIDEAKIAVQLQHVNIAQTFDLGRVGDTYYITMEFVDGADLYKILRRGSEQDLDMPLDVCAFVAKEAATGLDHAHRKRDVAGTPLGIVHRDVSPQNVLISHAGEVKLVDFGIAKATMRARQTQVGVIKGKYYYMSPEQAWGDPLDHRSDIFSCGIVLYEMMTGQMLYLEEDLQKLLEMVRRADIAPPTRLRRDIPPQLERIAMHALAKKPEDRYQSASDFATDLERFLHTYSPVFTASKLSAHLRKVVGDPVPIIEPPSGPVAPARSPHQQTQPIDARELVHERSEIADENSVIFRMDELRRREQQGRHGDDESTAAELPQRTKRAPTGAQATIPAPPPRRSPTEPPPRRAPTEQPARTRAPTAPQVPTRVPSRIPTQVPGSLQRPRPPTAPPPVRAPAPPPRPAAKPAPPAPPAKSPGMIAMNTLALQANDLSDVEEMTSVSGPPGFDGGATRDGGPALDYGDYEPTMIDERSESRGEGALPASPVGRGRSPLGIDGGEERTQQAVPAAPQDPTDSEDGPTTTRDGMGVPLPQAVQLSSSETMPRPHAEIRSRLRPGAPAHPALSASSPTPAVSSLRQARSRRTPPGGVPQQNVLQQIVGAQPSEPMPTVQMRGVPPSSDGVPRAMPDGASSGAPTNPQGHATWTPEMAFAATQQPIPGQNQLPVPYGPPGMIPSQQAQGPMPLIAPPTPPPGSMPVAQLPPHLVQYGGYGMPTAAQTINPGYPQQYGQPSPMSFTKQMQAAIELDDIPQRYKFQENRTRRILVIASVAALFIVGIGVTVMLMRGTEEAPKATIVVESTPAGAKVMVDGAVLGELTPARFPSTPGARLEIDVIFDRHKPWHQALVVPSSGGEVRVIAVLETMTGKVRINSQPGGAEIRINGELRGLTPKTIDGLDPSIARQVELRLKDFPPEVRDLDWSKSDTIDLDVKFFRK